MAVTREDLLRIFLDEEPTARSPYGLYGHPPMWKVAERDGVVLFARPCRTMVRIDWSWREVDGVCWQTRRGETWLDQAREGTFEIFLEAVGEFRVEKAAA
jgi:hypothetical protein